MRGNLLTAIPNFRRWKWACGRQLAFSDVAGVLFERQSELGVPPSADCAAPATTAEPNTSIGALPAGGGLSGPAGKGTRYLLTHTATNRSHSERFAPSGTLSSSLSLGPIKPYMPDYGTALKARAGFGTCDTRACSLHQTVTACRSTLFAGCGHTRALWPHTPFTVTLVPRAAFGPVHEARFVRTLKRG